MTISEMLGQSGLLTLLGMCVVFGFLIILIICMKLLQIAVHALKLDKDVENSSGTANSTSTTSVSQQNNDAVVAAIAAAVKTRAEN